jgi:serine/threonine-protein kinase
MANVYVGRSVESGRREELVALKVMRDELGRDPKFLRMFSDEAKILARLSHPNAIRTYESGITADHRFIVMELLAGRPLADGWDLLAARGQAISLRLGAWVCARIAQGLHAAHELTDDAGVPLHVVHRDVNPSNMFLTYDGEAKLIDFGLAKARVRRTRSAEGVVKGKIPYLAPEQLTKVPIDRRIDVYALGTTLWELATMRRLFKRDTDLDTLRAIQGGVVPDPRTLVSDFPGDLRAVLGRALEADRDRRYPTADAMRADLDAFVDDGGGEMKAELAALVSRTFPGEEARHRSWRAETMTARKLATVPPPPIPVPTASSNLMRAASEIPLDDADIEIVKG